MEKQKEVKPQKVFNVIKSKELTRMLAIIILSITLVLETVEFIIEAQHGFTFERLFPYGFDLISNIFIISTLIAKKIGLIEVALIVLKVFDGTYYPFIGAQRLDMLLMTKNYSLESVAYFIIFATSSFLLIIALFFFCVFKYNGSRKAWDIMKMFILGAAIAMLVAIALYIHQIAVSNVEWESILEPCCLFLLFTGMLLTCEYVEENPIFLEPDKYLVERKKRKQKDLNN